MRPSVENWMPKMLCARTKVAISLPLAASHSFTKGVYCPFTVPAAAVASVLPSGERATDMTKSSWRNSGPSWPLAMSMICTLARDTQIKCRPSEVE